MGAIRTFDGLRRVSGGIPGRVPGAVASDHRVGDIASVWFVPRVSLGKILRNVLVNLGSWQSPISRRARLRLNVARNGHA